MNEMLQLKKARERQRIFEAKYGVSFAAFKIAWDAGEIADRHSYAVELDYWGWEAAMTDESRLLEMTTQLL